MKEVLLTAPRELRVVRKDTPVPGPEQILLEVRLCGVCPSDVRKWSTGVDDLNRLPVNLGHETVGQVIAVGTPELAHLVGQRLFADGYGGFATHRLVAADALRRGAAFVLPDELTDEQAVFVEPLADCIFAVEERARAWQASTAIVFGCGQMGLQLIQLLRHFGLAVFAIDPLLARRTRAAALGANIVDGALDEHELVTAIVDRSPGGVDIAIVATPAPDAIGCALQVLRTGGRCVLFAGYPPHQQVSLPIELVHSRSLEVLGARWIGVHTPRFALYRRAARLLAQGAVRTDDLIEQRVGLDGLADALAAMQELRILKAVVEPGRPS